MYKIISLKRIMLCIAGMAAAVICCNLIFSAMSRNAVQTANNARNDGIELPILMYHGILKDTKLQGDYVISPSQFEQDLKMLREKGCHTVTVSNLTDYVYSDKPLPENPVMLTFDDGYYNNYLYAYPLLKKYECSAVISPIAYYSELYSNSDEKQGASYAHCTWQQLAEMQESGLVEVQNHSYNMHSLSGRKGIQQKQVNQAERRETRRKEGLQRPLPRLPDQPYRGKRQQDPRRSQRQPDPRPQEPADPAGEHPQDDDPGGEENGFLKAFPEPDRQEQRQGNQHKEKDDDRKNHVAPPFCFCSVSRSQKARTSFGSLLRLIFPSRYRSTILSP